jgi:hypothetical protein
MEKIREFLREYDPYFADVYTWSYELVDDVQDASAALRLLTNLDDYRPAENCIEPCGGFFKFVSKVGYQGFAYCAFTSAAEVVSTPYNCKAFHFESSKGSYIAAFSSPFFGAGFGAGFEGLYCSVKDVKAIGRLAAGSDTVADVFSAGLTGISLQTQRISDDQTILYGVRAFQPSRVLQQTYEYTTATLTFTKDGATSASVTGLSHSQLILKMSVIVRGC